MNSFQQPGPSPRFYAAVEASSIDLPPDKLHHAALVVAGYSNSSADCFHLLDTLGFDLENLYGIRQSAKSENN